MLVSEAGRVISERREHLSNALLPMLVTLVFSRFITLVSDLQFRKALLLMLVSVSGRVISARAQPLKALLPMLVSEAGRVISEREVQF